nr:hypothetical protein B0A51_08530 [Rachicladosporium sp. CCFEE 5018]
MILALPPAIRAEVLKQCFARRSFSIAGALQAGGHENPLGLPRSKSIPQNLSARMQRNVPQKRPIPNVKKIIAVSSAKGGVGKSTLAVNLALASARQGISTGILDADIYGPSIPTLLNLEGLEPELDDRNHLVPLTAYGLKAISIGFLIPVTSPLAWRAPLLQKALSQLLFETSWPPLDLLVLDLPPGTGDIQLTIAQSLELAGAVIVSTPQDLALRDAVRGVGFWERTGVKRLGMVQNMSGFVCGGCGEVTDIFGGDGAKRKCEELGLEFLGDIPLHASICADADAGKPTVVANPNGPQAKAFGDIMSKISKQIGLA